MRVRLNGVAVAIMAFAAVGCGDRTQSLPPGPRMLSTATVSSLTCDFTAINKLVQMYFSPTEANDVRALVRQMQDAGTDSVTARDRGFDVMVHIADNITAGNTDSTDASDLTNALLACMFTSVADLPATFPEDFTSATDPSSHGAYAVRGGTFDPPTAPVLSRPDSAPFSGIAPPDSSTWPGIMSGNPAPARMLVYGRPGSDPLTYDWKLVPRTTKFSPPAVVGVCVDPFVNNTSLLHEEHVGLLPFVDAPFLVPGQCSPTASAPGWTLQFASKLMHWGSLLVAPRELQATALLNPGGLGGTSGGIGSEFGPQAVDTVVLTFVQLPKNVRVGETFSATVRATDKSTGEPVPNVAIHLTAVNNNGTPAILDCSVDAITDGAGIATFSNLCESKTGAYRLVASGVVIGRDAIAVPAVTSSKFNVKP